MKKNIILIIGISVITVFIAVVIAAAFLSRKPSTIKGSSSYLLKASGTSTSVSPSNTATSSLIDSSSTDNNSSPSETVLSTSGKTSPGNSSAASSKASTTSSSKPTTSSSKPATSSSKPATSSSKPVSSTTPITTAQPPAGFTGGLTVNTALTQQVNAIANKNKNTAFFNTIYSDCSNIATGKVTYESIFSISTEGKYYAIDQTQKSDPNSVSGYLYIDSSTGIKYFLNNDYHINVNVNSNDPQTIYNSAVNQGIYKFLNAQDSLNVASQKFDYLVVVYDPVNKTNIIWRFADNFGKESIETPIPY